MDGDDDTYRSLQGPKCGGAFDLTLDSLDGTPLNLYAGPANNITQPTNPRMYAYSDGQKTHDHIQVSSIGGVPWNVLVTHNVNQSAYRLTYVTPDGCSIGGNVQTGGGGAAAPQMRVDTSDRTNWQLS